MSQIKQGTRAIFTLIPDNYIFNESDKVDALIHNGKKHFYYAWDHNADNQQTEGRIFQDVQSGFLMFLLSPSQTKTMLGRYTLEIRINDQIADSTEITITANKISSYKTPE